MELHLYKRMNKQMAELMSRSLNKYLVRKTYSKFVFFLIRIHSMQGLTATTKHRINYKKMK